MSGPLPPEFMEGLRLTERERAVLIEQMRKAGHSERRRTPRCLVDGELTLTIAMEYPGGSSARFRIYPWDLWTQGLAFLHRAFVYPGTRCTITGDTIDKQPISVRAEVSACNHVGGIIHTVALKFEMDVDPEAFVGEAAAATLATGAAPPPPAPTRIPDWWTATEDLAAELGKLAHDKAPAESIKKRAAALMDQINTAGAPPAPAAPGSAPTPAPPAAATAH